MSTEIKKLDFLTAMKNGTTAFNLLNSNRARLSQWFWWADEKITPNWYSFYLFLMLYLFETKRKKIEHKIHPIVVFDEQFIIFNDGKMAGMCGLDNIDTEMHKNAELWLFTFAGNHFGTADSALKLIENYSADMKLNSLYAHVQLQNDKSQECLARNNYAKQEKPENALVSKKPVKIAPVYVFKKILTR